MQETLFEDRLYKVIDECKDLNVSLKIAQRFLGYYAKENEYTEQSISLLGTLLYATAVMNEPLYRAQAWLKGLHTPHIIQEVNNVLLWTDNKIALTYFSAYIMATTHTQTWIFSEVNFALLQEMYKDPTCK